MLKRFLVFLMVFMIFSFVLSAQNIVNQFIDSITFVSNPADKARLSEAIAKELKDTDWERTIHYLEYAEEQAKASASDEVLAQYFKVSADIYYEKDVFDIALGYYQKAYVIYQQLEDKQRLFKLENDLAIIYARMNNDQKALYYFKRVFQYQSLLNDSTYLAQLLNNIGTLYMTIDVDSSEIYYLRSLAIANKLHNIELNAYLYSNLGRISYMQNQISKAEDYFNKSNDIADSDMSRSTKLMVYGLSAEYYLKTNQNNRAIEKAQKGIELLKKDTIGFDMQNLTRILYLAYLAEKDYKNATAYFKTYDLVRDSINVESKAVNVERLKLELEYKTKEQIRALKEERKTFKYFVIGLSLIASLLFLLILLGVYRHKLSKANYEKKLIESNKKELAANLELKNSTLIAKAMAEIHRTEIIQGILEDLKEIKLKAVKKETQYAIDHILNRLERDINPNIWQEFEVSFEQVHTSFFKELNEKHADLSASDRRLCALLLLNLTSKEISQISGQSFKSVENARTRLRKKLGLTNTKTDLIVYLNSLN